MAGDDAAGEDLPSVGPPLVDADRTIGEDHGLSWATRHRKSDMSTSPWLGRRH